MLRSGEKEHRQEPQHGPPSQKRREANIAADLSPCLETLIRLPSVGRTFSYSRRAVLARGVGDSERFFCSENTVSMENGDSAFIGVAFDRCNVSVRYGYRDMSLRDVTYGSC